VFLEGVPLTISWVLENVLLHPEAACLHAPGHEKGRTDLIAALDPSVVDDRRRLLISRNQRRRDDVVLTLLDQYLCVHCCRPLLSVTCWSNSSFK